MHGIDGSVKYPRSLFVSGHEPPRLLRVRERRMTMRLTQVVTHYCWIVRLSGLGFGRNAIGAQLLRSRVPAE